MRVTKGDDIGTFIIEPLITYCCELGSGSKLDVTLLDFMQ